MNRIELVPSLLLVTLGAIGGLAGFKAVSYFESNLLTENQQIVRASDNELQERLDVYRMHIRSGGQTGCQMNVENYGTYHAIRREIERRTLADATEAGTNE